MAACARGVDEVVDLADGTRAIVLARDDQDGLRPSVDVGDRGPLRVDIGDVLG